VEFCVFDANYIERLTAADPDTEAHFTAYFAKFLSLKLRSRRVSPEIAEDVRQETLLRVIKALRKGTKIAQPERFGAFVNTVCNNVLLEFWHKESRLPSAGQDAPERADETIDLDAPLVNEQRKRAVAKALDDLSERDRKILRLVFFDELDREEICRRMNINGEYLRVLVHRAKSRFEAAYVRKARFSGLLMALFCNGALGCFITSMRTL